MLKAAERLKLLPMTKSNGRIAAQGLCHAGGCAALNAAALMDTPSLLLKQAKNHHLQKRIENLSAWTKSFLISNVSRKFMMSLSFERLPAEPPTGFLSPALRGRGMSRRAVEVTSENAYSWYTGRCFFAFHHIGLWVLRGSSLLRKWVNFVEHEPFDVDNRVYAYTQPHAAVPPSVARRKIPQDPASMAPRARALAKNHKSANAFVFFFLCRGSLDRYITIHRYMPTRKIFVYLCLGRLAGNRTRAWLQVCALCAQGGAWVTRCTIQVFHCPLAPLPWWEEQP